MYTSYASDMALLNTPGKRLAVVAVVVFALAAPLLFEDSLLVLLGSAAAFAIGAIGLNLVTGYAGQVSLGHAFFVAIGAYTAAALTGDPGGRVIGFGMPLFAGLIGAALVAGLAGVLVAPLAVRLRGLYLAIVTLGLVFLGEHIWREWNSLTGGLGIGRPGTQAYLLNVTNLQQSGALFTGAQKVYWLVMILLILLAVAARNLARSDVGRAFSAVRDRDIAAEIIGVDLTRTKFVAFTISSAYAGIAGALLYTVNAVVEPSSFNLLMSVRFLAMILIGGAATISGSIMGAFFIALLPTFTQTLPRFLPFVSAQATGGGLISSAQLEALLYGLLIVVFLLFEPRGLFGIWMAGPQLLEGLAVLLLTSLTSVRAPRTRRTPRTRRVRPSHVFRLRAGRRRSQRVDTARPSLSTTRIAAGFRAG